MLNFFQVLAAHIYLISMFSHRFRIIEWTCILLGINFQDVFVLLQADVANVASLNIIDIHI